MTRMLDDVLEQFRGKTADQIADIVRNHKIKGRMGTAYGCPMALLLKGQSTGDYVIGRAFIARRSGNVIDKARTPTNVATFIRKFDIGGYPDLVAPPPRCLAPRGRKKNQTSGSSGNRGYNKKKPIVNHIAKLVGRFHETAGAAK